MESAKFCLWWVKWFSLASPAFALPNNGVSQVLLVVGQEVFSGFSHRCSTLKWSQPSSACGGSGGFSLASPAFAPPYNGVSQVLLVVGQMWFSLASPTFALPNNGVSQVLLVVGQVVFSGFSRFCST